MKTSRYLLTSLFALFMTVSAQAMDKKAALSGYCPVCYIAAGKAVKGTEKFKVSHEGQMYYFVNADAMKAFTGEPKKFLPAYDGKCAFCISKGKTADADPTVFMVHEGRIFLNASKDLEMKFKKNLKENVAAADMKWKVAMMAKEKEMAGKK